jgi:hypothetical protein
MDAVENANGSEDSEVEAEEAVEAENSDDE